MLKLIILFSLVSFYSTIFGREPINGVSAIVGNQIILKSDIDRELMAFSYQSKTDVFSDPLEYQKYFNKTRDDLVLRKVALLHAYKDTNIVVSGDEIERSLNAQIDLMVGQVGSEQALEKELKKNIREIKADYWDMIKDMLFFDRLKFLKTQNVYVTRNEVVDFFSTNPSLFPDVEERFDFSLFELKKQPGLLTEQKLKTFLSSVRDSILDGSFSFSDMAKKHSEDPGSAPSGGNLGFTKRGALVKDFEEIAYNLNVGEISMPFKSVFGYHLVLLLDRVGEKINTQHILKTISPTTEDVLKSSFVVDSLFAFYQKKPNLFDSFIKTNKKESGSLSGVYKRKPVDFLPTPLIGVFGGFSGGFDYQTIETDDSFFILKVDKKYNQEPASILNSWSKIENLALYNKKEKVFNNWIQKLKKNIYIGVY